MPPRAKAATVTPRGFLAGEGAAVGVPPGGVGVFRAAWPPVFCFIARCGRISRAGPLKISPVCPVDGGISGWERGAGETGRGAGPTPDEAGRGVGPAPGE